MDLASETALPLKSAPPSGSDQPCKPTASGESPVATPAGGSVNSIDRQAGLVKPRKKKGLPGSPHPDKRNSDADKPLKLKPTSIGGIPN